MTHKIVEVFESDWQEALAGKAYSMIKNDNSKYLDEYEDERDSQSFDSLIIDLKTLNDEKDWNQSLKLLAHRIAIQYCAERITGRNISPGGMMTLIGHAKNEMIEMGFLGTLAAELDQGVTEKLFYEYLNIDMSFQKAINTGEIEKARLIADQWRLVQISLRDSYENLLDAVKSLT